MRVLPRITVLLPVLLLSATVVAGGLGCDDSAATVSAEADHESTASTTAVLDQTATTVAGMTTSLGPTTTVLVTTTLKKVTATTLASTEVKLSNGHIKSLGFIHDMWTDAEGRHLTIDYCDILYWDEATEAAREAGMIGETEEIPVYVRNQSTRLRAWMVSDSADLVTCTREYPWDPSPDSACTWDEFVDFWESGVDGLTEQGATDFYGLPFWIERDGDTVVKITEQFMS